MKKILVCLFSLLFLLSSCADHGEVDGSMTNMSDEDSAVTAEQEELSAGHEKTDNSVTDMSAENSVAIGEFGGQSAECQEHSGSYHSVYSRFMFYVGQDVYRQWRDTTTQGSDEYGRFDENVFSIQAFVEEFGIPRSVFEEIVEECASGGAPVLGITEDEYRAEFGYTDEQIDALYSGDQGRINEAFCGSLAYYNETDGELYSIYWMNEHTAAEWSAAGIPVAEAERILDEAGNDPYCTSLAENMTDTLAVFSMTESEAVK